MSEQELKLHVPSHAQAGIVKDLTQQQVTRIQLHALYFDTPTRALVKARIALRLRQEGRHWIQTLKMPGDHPLSRIELNHARPDPSLDLSLYAGTEAGDALAKISEPLGICYETDVKRMLRTVKTRQGQVEIAFDQGWLRAGALTLPISEIEFELISGQVEAIFIIGQRWQTSHGLVMDARSKAERGDCLALLDQTLTQLKSQPQVEAQQQACAKAIATFWAPRNAQKVGLDPQMSVTQALNMVTHECLDQIIRNAAVLAEVDTAGVMQIEHAEHVHQLRVGIRRLRSAWSLFNGLAPLPAQELRDAIKPHFAKLGSTRDDDVLNETLLPILSAAGQPPLAWRKGATHEVSASDVVTNNGFQRWLLDILSHAITPRHAQPKTTDRVKEVTLKQGLIDKLQKWHKRMLRDGLRFETLDTEARHALRKRAKRLRYGLQFAEALLPQKRLRSYRKQLALVQDILGEMNDLAIARERFVLLRDTQPSAWFACGWITSQLDTLTHQASAAFKQLAKTAHFWRDA
jgi:triphosphatase